MLLPTLVYKRTHSGDPDEEGVFGCKGCMGRVRSWNYGAVIGVGGQGREAKYEQVAGKVNWIGIGPHKSPPDSKEPLVTFDHFLFFGTDGPDLRDLAPCLAALMYEKGGRTVMTFSEEEQSDVCRLLELAEDEPPSPALVLQQPKTQRICRLRRSTPC